jgi:hypothetical protein
VPPKPCVVCPDINVVYVAHEPPNLARHHPCLSASMSSSQMLSPCCAHLSDIDIARHTSTTLTPPAIKCAYQTSQSSSVAAPSCCRPRLHLLHCYFHRARNAPTSPKRGLYWRVEQPPYLIVLFCGLTIVLSTSPSLVALLFPPRTHRPVTP